MDIKILGPGCSKCKKTEEYARNVVKRFNLPANISHETDIEKFSDYGVMLTPAVVLDGKVVCQGHVPTEHEIEVFLKKVKP